ncbi:MAG: hypothetical protein SPL26_02110 [Bacteroidales bacterium]|jgi:hypothetical protein|nr:hypothetical protein [Bacteroidales bacterium]
MKKLLLNIVLIILSLPSFACTTAIISAKASSTGRPLLWKQRDTENEYNVLAHLKGTKYSFTALFNADDVSHKSAYAGANDHGFAIVNNMSYNLRPDSMGIATSAGELMTKALGACLSVDDFEKLLLSLEQPNHLSTNFGVIDAFGGAAYFEVWEYGCRRYDVSDSPDGYLYRTNFSMSGNEGTGIGYARYETAGYLLHKRTGKGISPEYLIDGVGRSFYNAITGENALYGKYMAMDNEYIPRTKTTSSIVIEGIGEGDSPDGSILWTVIGYAPCAYCVPVWVCAGDEMPLFVCSGVDGKAAANVLANDLKHRLHPLKFKNGELYLDARTLRKEILPVVRKFEKKEFELGRKLESDIRLNGFSAEKVKKHDAEANARFEQFRKYFFN